MALQFFQPADRFRQLIVTDGGGITSDSGSGTALFTSDGNGNVNVGSLAENATTGVVQTLSTGNTVTVPANTGVVRVTAAAAVTGIVLPVGTRVGQKLTVIHEGAAGNTITYSTNVAGGTAQAGSTARRFEWDSVTNLWYPCL